MIILWSSLVAGPHEFPFHNGLSPFLYGLCSFSIRWRQFVLSDVITMLFLLPLKTFLKAILCFYQDSL